MLKRILACFILATCLCSELFAGGPYISPTVYIQDLTTRNSSLRGFNFQFAAGYYGFINYYYLAGELFAMPFAATMSTSHNEFGNSLRITQEYGASFLPGILLSEGLVTYLRLSVLSARFRAPTTTKLGGQFGLGLQTSLSTYWSLRGEYVYTGFSNAESLGSPYSDSFGISLLYKLDG